jgi:hypothetical protein
MMRGAMCAALALGLAACMPQDPGPNSASYAQPGSPRQGYYGRYDFGPATNYNPYDLPEYHGGYTPF